MTIDEKIAILQAYKEGKTIQVKEKDSNDWYDTEKPIFNFENYDYRIKPEPHYRPFESAEEVMEAIKEHGDWLHCNGRYSKIVEVTDMIIVRSTVQEPDRLDACLNEYHYTFLDGTPFGKLVEG